MTETRPIDGITPVVGGEPSPTTPVVESGESGWVDPDATRLMRVPSGEVAALDEVEAPPPDVSGGPVRPAGLDVPESPDGPPALTIDPKTRAALEALGVDDIAGKLAGVSALLARGGCAPEEARRLLARALQTVPGRPDVGLALLLELEARPIPLVARSDLPGGETKRAFPIEDLLARGGALARALPDVDAHSLAQLVARSAGDLQLLPASPHLAEHVGALYAGDPRPQALWMAELEVLLLADVPELITDTVALARALESARLLTTELFAEDPLAPRQLGLLNGALASLIADGGDVAEVRRLARRARAAVATAAPTLLVLALVQTQPSAKLHRPSSSSANRIAQNDRREEPSRSRRVEAVVEKVETRLDDLERDLPAGSMPDRAMLATNLSEQLSGSEQLYAALVQIFAHMGPRLRQGRLQRLRDRMRRASRRVGDPGTASARDWLRAVEAFGPLDSL